MRNKGKGSKRNTGVATQMLHRVHTTQGNYSGLDVFHRLAVFHISRKDRKIKMNQKQRRRREDRTLREKTQIIVPSNKSTSKK